APGTASRMTTCFPAPLPAFSHRYHFDLRLRQHIEQRFRNILRDLSRVQRAFEFIGSDEDFHCSASVSLASPECKPQACATSVSSPKFLRQSGGLLCPSTTSAPGPLENLEMQHCLL